RFVAVATPLTEATRRLVDAGVFEAMRDDAYLVNVARGPVVDEDALIDALAAGELAGAGLDVFREEPLPASSPLWDLDDVLVTPHASSLHRAYHEDIADLVRANLRNRNAGADLLNRVV
ncbi:NAD(P)-dependent oxidoreductase, partial [Halarchaeum acidiphilum]